MTTFAGKTTYRTVTATLLWGLVWSVVVAPSIYAKDRVDASATASSVSAAAQKPAVDTRRLALATTVTTTSTPLDVGALPATAFEDWDVSDHP